MEEVIALGAVMESLETIVPVNTKEGYRWLCVHAYWHLKIVINSTSNNRRMIVLVSTTKDFFFLN